MKPIRPAQADQRDEFTAFVREVEPRLRVALAAALGQEQGREAAAEAWAWGWEHWDRLSAMENPAGYLYRVGRSRARTNRRPVFAPAPVSVQPQVEPALPGALAELSERQRVVVVLVHGFEWRQREVADLLGIDPPTVATHLRRGLRKLRKSLKVEIDA